MSRLRPIIAGVAIGLAGASALALILAAGAPGVAHAAAHTALDAPTPTYNPLIVPTAASQASTNLAPNAISTSSAGIELAFTLSCVTTIAGLIIAALTLTALIRTGYGPFLRALLPGRRRLPASPEPTLRYRPSNQSGYNASAQRDYRPETGFDLYAEQPAPRSRRRSTRRIQGDEWEEWNSQPPRQPRPSQAYRGSSRGGRDRY